MADDVKSRILILKKYSKEMGFTVFLNSNDISYISWKQKTLNEPNIIKINKCGGNEHKQYYQFLHELGHYNLRKDWDIYKLKYPVVAEAEEYATFKKKYYLRKKINYKIECMKEEFDAWEEGINITCLLGLSLDIIDYRIYSYSFLIDYMTYYVDNFKNKK